MLLTIPSGCGKKAMMHAVIAETGVYFFVINGPEVIISKRTGESKTNLRCAFEDAKENVVDYNGVIIFIDKINLIVPRCDKAGGDVEKRIVSQLLTLLSSCVIVIARIDTRTNIISRQIIHSKSRHFIINILFLILKARGRAPTEIMEVI